MELLQKSIELAFEAHKGQTDKAGFPYILHPFRVMDTIRRKGSGEIAQSVAVLHDVVEDTHVTVSDISNQIDPEIAWLVGILTKRSGQSLKEYYERVACDSLTRNIKLADIEDNTQWWRLDHLDYATKERLLKKYNRGRHYLLTGDWIE